MLFVSNLGEAFHPVHMTKLVRDYVVAGVGHRGSCHLFRHSMATLMLEGGADIRFIQAMLGHAKLGLDHCFGRCTTVLMSRELVPQGLTQAQWTGVPSS